MFLHLHIQVTLPMHEFEWICANFKDSWSRKVNIWNTYNLILIFKWYQKVIYIALKSVPNNQNDILKRYYRIGNSIFCYHVLVTDHKVVDTKDILGLTYFCFDVTQFILGLVFHEQVCSKDQNHTSFCFIHVM